MWVPKAVFELFQISKNAVDDQRAELSKLHAENILLRTQLTTTQANFEWIRVRVNQLEVERAQLVEKAYGIKTPVPEISRTPIAQLELGSDIFEDVGEKMAKQLGFPTYIDPFQSSPN